MEIIFFYIKLTRRHTIPIINLNEVEKSLDSLPKAKNTVTHSKVVGPNFHIQISIHNKVSQDHKILTPKNLRNNIMNFRVYMV